MAFDISPLFPRKVLKLAPGSAETVPYRYLNVLMRFTLNHHVTPGKGQMDFDMKLFSLTTVTVRRFYNNLASDNLVIELILSTQKEMLIKHSVRESILGSLNQLDPKN